MLLGWWITCYILCMGGPSGSGDYDPYAAAPSKSAVPKSGGTITPAFNAGPYLRRFYTIVGLIAIAAFVAEGLFLPSRLNPGWFFVGTVVVAVIFRTFIVRKIYRQDGIHPIFGWMVGRYPVSSSSVAPALGDPYATPSPRSEERRVGKERRS